VPRRLGAIVYDLLIASAILMLAGALVLPFNDGKAVRPGSWWFDVYLVLCLFAYFGYCWWHGQTLGMKAWRIYIRQVDGAPVTWLQSAIRLPVAVLGGAALGLGIWWCWFDPQQQSLADRVSGTSVRFLKQPQARSP